MTTPAVPDLAPFRERPLDDQESGAETCLRPRTLDEFIGQGRVVENLGISIRAAKSRGEALDHVLLTGMPGLGKTTLSRLIASELGVEIRSTSGPALRQGRDLMGLLTDLKAGDVLFIDEIHRMSMEAEEYLYAPIEDYRIDVVVDKGLDARTYSLPIPRFTLVGATTRAGMISAPLRSRFGIFESLDPYPDSELTRIIVRSAGLLDAHIEDEAAYELARRSRGTPRFANRFLRRVRDIAQLRVGAVSSGSGNGAIQIERDDVMEGLERLGVDENGLDRIDRRILRALFQNADRPLGLKTIAVFVGEEERTIEDVYEPYLIQRGWIIKTPRGRLATQRAIEHMERESRN